MEIYSLKDEVPEGRRVRKTKGVEDGVEKGEGVLRVTDLKQGVKNPERVNVYVNGKYALSLDVVQVVDLAVKVGMVLTEEQLAELKQASEFGKAYQRALEWVLVRPRSVRELRDYLRRRSMRGEMEEKKRGWEREREMADLVAKGEEVEARKLARKDARIAESLAKREKYDFDDLIVERLCERGYVDDKRFAEWYVENRFVKKGVSRKRLKMELVKKGVTTEIIEEVLDGRDDEEEIRKIIARKRVKYSDPDKLIAYLCRQGFSYDLVREMVKKEEF